MGPSALLSLLHLCDSLFPIGAFAHSDGLEAATSVGLVRSAADLRDWMSACVDEAFARMEGPAVRMAWHAFTDRRWSDLHDLDEDMSALRPASASRRGSRAMGARLVKTWQHVHARPELAALIEQLSAGPTLPVAFGIVGAAASIDCGSTLSGYVYTRLAATVSAAMRLMAIGQHEAHAILGEILDRVPPVIDAILERDELPAAFTPALDIAAMSQQYVHSRLFRS